MLQGAEAEEEADELLKRHLERSISSSSVVVLRRNNSADRLLATTEPDPALAEQLADAEPRSCLAARFGRTHEHGQQTQPLLGCALCSRQEGYSTCLPLLVGGEVLGAALVRHSAALTESEHRAAVAAVGQAGPVLANLRNLALARFRAATDALTGLPNSREVQDTLKRMAAHASRAMSPLAALLLDLDHFKQINDSYGHALGGDVLAALGTTIQGTLRASDFVGRYGGEEFVILLPDTGRAEAEVVAEKIRAAVSTIPVSGVARPITASTGLAVLPDDATDSVTLLRNADRALYSAKSNGRNASKSQSSPVWLRNPVPGVRRCGRKTMPHWLAVEADGVSSFSSAPESPDSYQSEGAFRCSARERGMSDQRAPCVRGPNLD